MLTNHRSKYIDDIEILRAFAILLVFFQHFSRIFQLLKIPYTKEFYHYLGGGKGVDLFFVISGFVIARSLLPKLQKAPSAQVFFQQTISFWIRRFWRISPSAWLWLIIPTILALVFNQLETFGSIKGNLAGLAAGFLNIYNIYFVQVFAVEGYRSSTFVHWSLSLEAQFYLILPFIVFFTRKRLVVFLIILTLIQLLWFRTPWMLILRTDEFFIGVLLAIWQQGHASYHDFKPTFLNNRLGRLLFLGVLLCGLMVMSGPLEICPLPYKWSFAAIISGLLVMAASYNQNYFIQTRWLKSILLWVGSRSYAIYLIHIPVFHFMKELYKRYFPKVHQHEDWFWLSVLCCASCIFLTCIISELNYLLVEEPFRKKGRLIAKNYLEGRNVDMT